MKSYKTILAVTTGGILLSQQAVALEVDREVLPRITVAGRVIATADSVSKDSNTTAEDEINIEDSVLLLRFDKRMYEDGVAGAVLGFKEVDDNLKFSEAHVNYWNQDFEVKLGRTRLRNTLVEFPTLRDDDLLGITHVGNGASNEEFDQVYGSTVSFDWFVDRKNQSLGAWFGDRTTGSGFTDASGFNSYGLGYRYDIPEDLLYVKRLRHAGILLDSQKVKTGTGDEWVRSVIAGAEFNLNMNPQSNWSMGVQGIVNNGVDDQSVLNLSGANAVAHQARADYTAAAASLRYTRRPKLLTRWQAGVTVGYKDFDNVNDATQWSVVPSFVYRIGQGVDLLAQVKHTDYDNGLYSGGDDTTFQLGLSFSLESRFNDNIGERNSILNLEHGYIK